MLKDTKKNNFLRFVVIMLFFSQLTTTQQVFAIGFYGTTLIDLIGTFFIIYIIYRVYWHGDQLKISNPILISLIFLLIIASLLSGLYPLGSGNKPEMVQFFKTFIHFSFLLTFTILVGIYRIDAEYWFKAIKLFLFLSIIFNLFGVYQIFARAYDLPLAWLDLTNASISMRSNIPLDEIGQLSLQYENFFRATSIFSEPSALAVFNVYVLIFLFAPYVQDREPFFKSRIINYSIVICSIIALFLCFSLTGLVSISLVLIFGLIFEKKKHLRKLLAIICVAIACIFVADYYTSQYSEISVADLFVERLTGIFNFSTGKTTEMLSGESFEGRLNSSLTGFEIWRKSPITGTGVGLYAHQNKNGFIFADISISQCMAELGLFGSILFISIIVILFIKAFKFIGKYKLNEEIPSHYRTLSGILIYLILIQIVINFISGDNLIHFNTWLFIGLILSIFNSLNEWTDKNDILVSIVKDPVKTKFTRSLNAYRELWRKGH
jgi:hypothetical protein